MSLPRNAANDATTTGTLRRIPLRHTRTTVLVARIADEVPRGSFNAGGGAMNVARGTVNVARISFAVAHSMSSVARKP